jgi:hypothetical protein
MDGMHPDRPVGFNSPFLFPDKNGKGVFDLQKYLDKNNGGKAPDFVSFQLGLNDFFGAQDHNIVQITEKSLEYLGVERKLTKEEKKAAQKNTVEVPDVTGMDSKDAIRNIKLYGLKEAIIPEDHSYQSFVVVDQYPKAGTRVEKESVVYIYSE